MNIPFLEPEQDNEVKWKSSISQHSNKLSVVKGEEVVPISYDVLDFIDCDGTKSHRAVVADGDDIGFNFPTKQCCYYTDEYVYYDGDRTELRVLPHWFGEGMYEAQVEEFDFVNDDNASSLGVRNRYDITIGLNYALADETLEPSE